MLILRRIVKVLNLTLSLILCPAFSILSLGGVVEGSNNVVISVDKVVLAISKSDL